MGHNCGVCGTPLFHIDEPCPNCLPGMAERPPTYRCLRCETLQAELAAVKGLLREAVEVLKTAKIALDHNGPEDCWATGPLTGDPIQDLIVCPGCSALKEIKAFLSRPEIKALRGGE